MTEYNIFVRAQDELEKKVKETADEYGLTVVEVANLLSLITAKYQKQALSDVQDSIESSKMALALSYYQECTDNRIHFQDVPRYLEKRLEKENEEVAEAIEIYVRYNLYDRRITDRDLDYAKTCLTEVDKVTK